MDIVFCSLSDRPVFSTPMFQHLEEYCVKNNYKCVLEYKSLCDERAPAWSKIPLLQREMKKNQDIPYIVWIDDDIIITNKNVRFEDLIKPYDFKNILLSEEIYPTIVLYVNDNCEFLKIYKFYAKKKIEKM